MSVDTIWYTRCPVPTASSVAISQGGFDDEFAPDGIVVQSLRAAKDAATRQSHFDHRQQNSFRHGGNAPPIWSRSQGQDVVVLGMTWLPQYQRLLALPDSGIRTLADLRGKRLAVPRRVGEKIDFWRASTLQGFLQALATEGMVAGDVELVDLPVHEPYLADQPASRTGALFDARQYARTASTECHALIRGDVDVIYHYGASGPFLEAFLGAQVVFDFNAHADRRAAVNNGTPNLLTVSGGMLRERPDLVTRYVACILRAAQWAAEHRDETFAIIAREVSVADEWVTDAFGEHIHQQLAPAITDELIQALAIRKDFMREHGFIEHDFWVQEWVNPAPLEAARAMLEN